MFRKITHRQLIVVLVIFIAIISVDRVMDDKGESNFDKDIIRIDTAQVTAFVIGSKPGQGEEVKITKGKEGWTVQKGAASGPADEAVVKSLVNMLGTHMTVSLAATSPEKWKDFAADDSLGTRFQVVENGEKTLDVVIGRFSFQQQRQTAITYIRPYGQDRVYAVEGFFGMSLTQGYESFRDKNLIRAQVADWTKVDLRFPGDSSFVFTKEGNNWRSEVPLDSAKVAQYMASLSALRGAEIVEDYEENFPVTYSLRIGDQNREAVEINVFQQDSATYVLHSSMNPTTYFTDHGVLFKRLFPSLESLQAMQEGN